ncbi:MAG TPA: flagellar biosynthetic protein FliO [Candidatus Binatia bacterium]|nr:flagellar biosynthetic protein FliO [Candidatus Binatia bacterium]
MQEISKLPLVGNGCVAARDSVWQRGRALWRGLVEKGKRPQKSLRLCESLSLGERRFVAVIAYRQSRFLLGGTPGSVVLLARLGDDGNEPTFTNDVPDGHCREHTH